MPLPTLIVPFLLSAALAEDAPIVVKAYPWAPFISPMGEPFRPPSTGEAPIARWFVQADRNRDGSLTEDEMQADADRFFAKLDSNRDGQIDPDERRTYETEIAPEVQVNSDWRTPRGSSEWRDRKRDGHDGYQVSGLQGAARYGLLNMPQPVAAADADFNRAITSAEFRQAAAYRFGLLDQHAQGRLTLAELETRLPLRPKGKRAKPRKNEPDSRIGQPLPEGS
jgi:hypothetical protein